MKKFLLVLACLLFAACGDSNPLLGSWHGSVNIDNSMIKQGLEAFGVGTELNVQFTENEIITTRGSQQTRRAIRYRVEKGNVYITDNTGKAEQTETWTLIPMKDKDTIEFPIVAGITATLKRSR